MTEARSPAAAPLAGPWSLAEAVGIVLLNLGLNLVAAAFASRGSTSPLDGGNAYVLWIAALTTVPYLLTFLAVVALMRRHGYTWTQGLGLRKTRLAIGIGTAMLIAVGGRMLAGGWTAALMGLGLEPPASLDVTTWFPADALGVVVLIAVTVGVAPFAEEVIYRGMLFPALRQHSWRRGAAFVSGLAFGVAHLNFTWLLLPTALLGMGLAYAFERTRSLYVAVAAHALFNLMAVSLLLFVDGAGVS